MEYGDFTNRENSPSSQMQPFEGSTKFDASARSSLMNFDSLGYLENPADLDLWNVGEKNPNKRGEQLTKRIISNTNVDVSSSKPISKSGKTPLASDNSSWNGE